MLATFCLRLACGMAAALVLLSPAQVNPRFYRVQFLTILGLTAVATAMLRHSANAGMWLALGGSMALAFLGSLVWSLDMAPAGRTLIGLSVVVQGIALGLESWQQGAEPASANAVALPSGVLLAQPAWRLADDLTSAALLGTAMTAMLMGHSYLIAPAMSLTPLLRLLRALFASTLLRMGLASVGLWSWSASQPQLTLTNETVLWLPLRWGLGFVGPLILGWMAWEAARIRSTQSATGILYVVVIFCFLGELTSQLLSKPALTL